MRTFLAIWRREVAAAFLSPVAYVTMVAFLLISGLTFVTGVVHNEGSSETLASLLFAAVVLWLTVLITVIAMRLFAEERRSGTLEALMTAPVMEAQVVLGKFAGAFTFLLVAALPAAAGIYIVAAIGPGVETVDGGAVAGGGLILALISSLCLAIGLFLSLLTRNQIIAAVCSFSAIWLVLLSGWLLEALPYGGGAAADYLATMAQIEDFSRGSVDTRPIVLYLSGTAAMLFFSIKTLETGRWK
jgi:ABC-2 type transport system permease protein